MNDLMMALLIGLGVMKLVDLIEDLIPWRQRPRIKIIYSTIFSAAASFMMSGKASSVILISLGALGFASIGHALESLILARRDVDKVVLVKGMRSRNPY